MAFFWSGCAEQSKEPFVVKVGSSVLTRSMILEALPKELKADPKAIENFTRNWINTEILYQKALNLEIDQEDRFRNELDNIEKKLLAELLIEQQINDRIIISEERIKEYYDANQENFTRKTDQAKVDYFISADEERAKLFRVKIGAVSGAEDNRFLEIANSVAALTDRLGTTDYIDETQMGKKMADAVFSRSKPGILSPIDLDGSNCFLRIVDIKPAGSVRALEIVSYEIEAILKSMDREIQYENYLEKLKSEVDIQFNPEEIR